MSEATAERDGAATAGALLKAARERQGMHVAVLAASLKVPPRKLELLEANRYDELPDPTFVRSLAMSMCRVLKIDAEPVLARLPQSAAAALLPSRGLDTPFRERGREMSRDSGDARRMLGLPALAALLLVGGALALYFWPAGGLQQVGGLLPAASAVLPAVEPASAVLPAPVVAAPASAVALPEAAASSPAVTASAAPAVVETVFDAPAASASAPTAALLVLRASEESWIEVRDARGELLLSRTLAAGEAAGLDGSPPLRLVIGNASATEVQFRGQPVSLGAPARDNVARLELR
ncbi:MAG TPA: helix-turn-helix domain-containing protein [Methylibium sp.]|nr:helix-turn-helix domain-containing protein [Methylibium sp.]